MRTDGGDLRVARPVSPQIHAYHWREDASCDGLTWMTLPGRVDDARLVCLGCPVSSECLEWIMDPETPPVAGVVAGLTPDQRGWVECTECGVLMRAAHSRRGLCFRCYPPAQVA